jgi:hypothetical protein
MQPDEVSDRNEIIAVSNDDNNNGFRLPKLHALMPPEISQVVSTSAVEEIANNRDHRTRDAQL